MPKPRINGTVRPVSKGTKLSYDPSRGLSIQSEYESAGDNLMGLANECIRKGIAFDMTRNGFKSSITTKNGGAAQGAYSETSIDNWQLLGNEIQKSLFDHPSLKYNLPYPQLWAKMAQFSSSDTGETDLISWMTSNGFNSDARDEALIWFRLYSSGITHFALGQYVLRHTVTVPGTHTYSVTGYGIECIYTTAALLSEANSTTVVYPLPAGMRSAIENIPVPYPASGYTWGWRKLPVTQTSSAYNRVDINFEYWLDQWNTSRLYAIA